MPPTERARGRYHLYRSTLPEKFSPADQTVDDAQTDASGRTSGEPAGKAARNVALRPVMPLFASDYFPPRLWIYTNFHCNLHCGYSAVASSPQARRGSLPLDQFRNLIDEAMREFAGHPNLVMQTSLDGAHAATHDLHRGKGSWTRTMDGIRAAIALALPLRVALTETPENTGEIDEVAALLADLGLPAEAFAVRPMLRRGLSVDGMDIGEDSTVPELTVTGDGLHWHPAGADLATSPVVHLAGPGTSLRIGKRLVTERFFAARLADGSLPAAYHYAI